ncbi:MAG TPA: hypothetical protein PKN92_08865 [Candidatus Hydrogenedentes bacterium]|nr:hypothetical protein [Candidatus Hydrogenedentota bacterium]
MKIRILFAVTLLCLLTVHTGTAAAAEGGGTALFFEDPAFPADERTVRCLKELLTLEGYALMPVNAEALCSTAELTAAHNTLLVLADAARLPMAAIPPVTAYLNQGGNLLALNAPLWQERLTRFGDEWLSLEAYRRRMAGTAPSHCFLDFRAESLASWHRSAYRMETDTRFSLVVADELGEGKKALLVDMPDMEGWDSACRSFETSPYPPGHVMTVFTAKGGPRTTRLAVELRERDGSRWMATVPLSPQWEQYVLLPEEFEFWESVYARKDTRLNPANVEMIAFTLAYSHTGHLHGQHSFAVADVGSAPLDEKYRAARKEIPVPAFEILAPSYKFYPMSDVTALVTAEDGLLPAGAPAPMPRAMMSMHPRPEAGGFDKGRHWRWLPLLEARGSDGTVRGYPAAMFFQDSTLCAGACRASFAIDDPGWYVSSAGKELLRSVIQRMRMPLFLLDGGADCYTAFEDQTVQVGATVANRSGGDEAVQLEFAIKDKNGFHTEKRNMQTVIPAGKEMAVESSLMTLEGRDMPVEISVRLLQKGEVLDEAHHMLHLWRPSASPSFVAAGKGRFDLNGKRWIPHGVNYMPSSGIGVEDRTYFEKWLGADAYHPRVIQRDLERCVAMGCNALSIFIYHESLKGHNLLDLLRRMDDLGMKANLSLRPGTPMDFKWDLIKELIEVHRLSENDTVFAYDLAWEPQFRPHEREPFNKDWEAWVVERYGSIENAEKDWGEPFLRDENGAPLNITPEMVGRAGQGAPRMAAYRRFLDTLLFEKYNQARTLVHNIDPNHPVSFRMSMAGDPTDWQTDALLYDFAYLGGAVDIFEPEAYGRIGDWEKVKPGAFTSAYARWANPALPVLWAEAGVHVWDMSSMKQGEDMLQFQAQYFDDFYRMLLMSRVDGIFWWWYPGGYRFDEKSDYGIINPDGTDRPSTKVIRKYAPLISQMETLPPVDEWLLFDRDKHNNGLTGIYSELKKDFWANIEAGKVPGLRTSGTGTDTRTCPALAVGNTPLNGNNPPKYMDSVFDQVARKDEQGGWIPLKNRASVFLPQTEELNLQISLTNLGEAALVPPDENRNQAGDVYLTVSGALSFRVPITQDVGRFQSLTMELSLTDAIRDQLKASGTIRLQMEARDRSAFGSVFELQLKKMQP